MLWLHRSHQLHVNACEKGSHSLIQCPEFLPKTSYQWSYYIKKTGICINCFSSKHSAAQCNRGGCKMCEGKHNSLLYFELKPVVPISDPKVETVKQGSRLLLCHLQVLLDTGSQINAVLHEFVCHKVLKQFAPKSTITDIGGGVTSIYSVLLTIILRYSEFSIMLHTRAP